MPERARVILISIDGLMPSAYTDPALAPYTPNLRALARDGVVGVLPTVTYPSHTTLITGVEPARHGIYDNQIFDPEGRSNGAWYWYADAIQVPTLPMAARARGLRAGAVTWPVTIGMDLDYLAPEYIGSKHDESVSMLKVRSRPRGLIEAAETARGKAFTWPQTDGDRTDLSLLTVKTYDPHVFLLHLIGLDSAQHNDGPGSPESRQTLKEIDAMVGELHDAVRQAGRADMTTMAVVSDHGFLPLQQQLQPNAALKQAGLLTVNERCAVTSWRAYYHSSGGSGFVYVKDAADSPRVAALLESLKHDPSNGIREVWNAEQLAAKGGHGFAPDRRALHSAFVMGGPAVQRRGSVGVIRMTQIAPTLAGILGVSLAPDAGAPLDLKAPRATAR